MSITDFMKALAESPSYDETSAKKLFDSWDRSCIVRMNKDGTWRKIVYWLLDVGVYVIL